MLPAGSLFPADPGLVSAPIRADAHWMDEHEYVSITQMRGSMSQQHVAEPAAFERANYLKVLRSYAMRSWPGSH